MNETQEWKGQMIGKSNTTGEVRFVKTDNNGVLQTQTTGTVTAQTLSGTVLNTPSAAIIVTTTSANLTVGNYKELALDVNISAITGTSPTYQILVDRLGADGIYYNIYTGTAVTAVGVVSISLGVGASTNVAFGNAIRIMEVVGGTTPSVTRSISVIGK